MRPGDYSEDDVRIRAAKRKRPRSKQRPSHDDAVTGFVTGVDRGRYRVLLSGSAQPAQPTAELPPVVAIKARELGRGAIVVGDRVRVVGDVSGRPGSLARIVGVQPRRSELTRTADDRDPIERTIVANADQLGIVVATTDPEPRPGFLDRALVAAYDAGIRPLLLLTKADLSPTTEFLETYTPLDIPTFTAGTADDLTDLLVQLTDHETVLLGQSGVGKSTLVNRLVPDAERRTGHVNEVTGRGRHTSSSAIALPLPTGGWIVDTPGVRSFGLAHVDVDRILEAFPRLQAAGAGCPRGCQHLPPDCALDDWIAGSGAPGDAETLSCLRRIIGSRLTEDY
ncbi:MAG: ribosome small subunit-dependent GTPase A [Actinobacteria bacterium]|nr:ribosome small subunit-dependent GTPase A [Actinomycetota bacterium]